MSKRAVILSAVPVAAALGRYVQPGDFIVACDAGYRNAARLGLQPDLIVGDFDSAPRPKTAQETIVPRVVHRAAHPQHPARLVHMARVGADAVFRHGIFVLQLRHPRRGAAHKKVTSAEDRGK